MKFIAIILFVTISIVISCNALKIKRQIQFPVSDEDSDANIGDRFGRPNRPNRRTTTITSTVKSTTDNGQQQLSRQVDGEGF